MGIDLPFSAFNWYSLVRLTLIILFIITFFLSDLLFATTGSAVIRLTTVSQATKK